MVQFGPFRDFLEVIRHFGEQSNVPVKSLKKSRPQTIDQVQEVGELNTLNCRGFLRRYPFTNLELLKRCGARLARWQDEIYVVAFPVYGPRLTNSPHRGYVIQGANGGNLPDRFGEMQKRLSIGESGLIGWHSLNSIATQQSKVVIKVEGLTDMLQAQALVPAELRGKIVVTTNACGASEVEVPREFGPVLKGLDLVLIHDSAGDDVCSGLFEPSASC